MECEGIKITGPSAVSEMNLITSTSFQRAPVVALQVYSSPGECQTKAPLSFSVPVKQPFYFSELHLLRVAATITITQGQDLAGMLPPPLYNRREPWAGRKIK